MKLRINVSDPALRDDLLAYLRRCGCGAYAVRSDVVEAMAPSAPVDEVYLRMEAGRVPPSLARDAPGRERQGSAHPVRSGRCGIDCGRGGGGHLQPPLKQMSGMLRTCETPGCGILTLGRFCLECEKKQAVEVAPDRRARLLETATGSSEAIEKTLEILIIERQRLHEQQANREPLEANRRAILYWQRELAQARRPSGISS